MSLKVKVCGMKYADNIEAVGALMPDYMGFIFFPSSPRFVGMDFHIPAGLPRQAGRVGVFVNEQTEAIIQLARQHQLTHIQLHGTESVAECKMLRNLGYSVIKAFAIHPDFDFNNLRSYSEAVDFFLFDSPSQNHGGSGKVFSWALLSNYKLQTPFFLSGGLTSEIVRTHALPQHPQFFALDVNSGVEDSPGIKNVNKVMDFLQTVKSISS
ncbi:MAG: phosphoribosylanthranilate isomerase [Cyclobacteriaceae bacterium]|nr:phosphoribosylanthranilate isomerase [Cyclobacteriaceae bacterium]